MYAVTPDKQKPVKMAKSIHLKISSQEKVRSIEEI